MTVRQEIVDYVRSGLAQGIGRDELKARLLKAGWSSQDAEDSMADAQGPAGPQGAYAAPGMPPVQPHPHDPGRKAGMSATTKATLALAIAGIAMGGIIVALVVSRPGILTGSSATEFTGIGSPASWSYASNGTFRIDFTNHMPDRLYMKRVAAGCAGGQDVEISVNEYIVQDESFTVFTDLCDRGRSGDSYHVNVTLVYDNADTGTNDISESGTLSGRMN